MEMHANDKGLTRREYEILEKISLGLSHRDVASTLFISPETVRKHVRNIYAKLNVNNKIAAINKVKLA